MKHLIAVGFLSLTALGMSSEQADAWCFHCKKCDCGKCCYTTTITLRQANAFTPICCGNLNCIGCGPVQIGCGQAPCAYPAPQCCGPKCNPACCSSCGECFDGGYLGQLPPASQHGFPGAQQTIPAPLPNPAGKLQPINMGAQFMPYGMPSTIQPAAYQPMYYGYNAGYGYTPMAANYGMQPTTGSAPYYWYNNPYSGR